jgi:hypothetical protein
VGKVLAMINTTSIIGARKKLQGNPRNEDEDRSMEEHGKMKLHSIDRLAEMAQKKNMTTLYELEQTKFKAN